jgi:hypothetical protein
LLAQLLSSGPSFGYFGPGSQAKTAFCGAIGALLISVTKVVVSLTIVTVAGAAVPGDAAGNIRPAAKISAKIGHNIDFFKIYHLLLIIFFLLALGLRAKQLFVLLIDFVDA